MVAQLELTPGDMLAGKFRIERVVGRGGMGVVVEATNTTLDQRVALKLLAQGASDAAAVERFSREAKAAARLKSEHVARVYDVGTDPKYGPFIVMELLEGRTLNEVVTTTGRLPIHRAVEYVIDACEGLAEAHARGIVHQDVKPANLFLVSGDDGRPTIKLLDFGIATMRSAEADPKATGPTAGTPAYLAPEQLRRKASVDHRADIWALGCVMFEILTGERAFKAQRFTELVTKILEEPPNPLPPEIPSGLAAIVLRCLEKDRDKRFASTGALALALLPFARARAHAAAARAVTHVKAGGLDPDLKIPSSMPPPPDGYSYSSVDIKVLPLPTFSEAPTAPALFDKTSAPPPSVVVKMPGEGDADANGNAKRKNPALLLVPIGVVALFVVFFLATRKAPPSATAPSAVASETRSPTTTSAPTSSPDPPSPTAPSVGSAASSASASLAPSSLPAEKPVVPPTRPRPSAATSAGASKPSEFEIRPTR